ncbi:glutathione S-transferase [Komagataeibacter xylinus]|uniref:Glutathione S-transferase n=1 Tax=Komagataeibacter xylinus TaxID=28448 RepID=A0A318PMN2_KOMXY|nr:DUF952 domain-containing protein [Komagataeibacter xylinus]AZV37903.1 DUF952 domain-containing protein [Komagataeibacter xylinus]PYD56846.1 glutathione S-transferase [Komagataeibacter xylinus]GBQ69970.1 hypothetical protein AA15237_0748 [Komagataeibacter xylinus NBRC 15237]
MTEHIVYKILTAPEHEAFARAGLFKGSPADVADGFIHFSTGPQVQGTLEKHFAGQSGLVLLAVDLALLDPAAVRWEPSRGGQLFPHLYAALPVGAVVATTAVTHDIQGRVQLPV